MILLASIYYSIILGTFGGNSDIGGLLSEISKMKDLFHPNVMTLLGISPNAALGPCIVMPYMANGSLLDYLKKERKELFLDFDVEENQVNKCQVVVYLFVQLFVCLVCLSGLSVWSVCLVCLSGSVCISSSCASSCNRSFL